MGFILFLLSTISLIYIILSFIQYHFPRLIHRFPPGPKGWPIIGAIPLLGTLPHASLANLARTFGPIMRLKLGVRDVIVVSTPESAKIFLKTLDQNFSNRPINAGSTNISYCEQDLVFIAMGPRWNLLRKLCNLHMLGTKSYKDWEPIRAKEIRQLVQDTHGMSLKGELVEVPSMLLCTMANIIGQKCLGLRVFSTEWSESDHFKKLIVEITKYVSFVHSGDFIPLILSFDSQGVVSKMKHLHQMFDTLITKIIKEHTSTIHERKEEPDFLDVLLESMKTSDLDMVNIKGILLNCFIAGIETTSGTIEWALTEMINNKEILEQARKEMDRVVGKNRQLRESDLPNLPYLKAICKETLRLHPPLPLSVPRQCTKTCDVNGFYIPKNSWFMVNIWAIGRDPNVWPDPIKFNPDRFMGGERANIEPSGQNFELIPFGGGRRMCVGIQMGISIVEYTLGTLVHSFEWRIPSGVPIDVKETSGSVLHKAVPLSAMAVPRLHASAYVQL